MKIPNPIEFLKENKKWRDAGSPERSQERIEEIFNICSSDECQKYLSISENVGQCKVCSCYLRKDGHKINKIRYATTRCPLENPKWIEEDGIEKVETKKEEEPIQEPPPETQQFIKRPPKSGCGCGK